jgi:hypothetical protein
MAWQPRHQHEGGYLMIDHRASPGLPDAVARASGFNPRETREGKLFEASTLTCSHCGCAVIKNPLRTHERANCAQCGPHFICDLCNFRRHLPGYVHTPYARIADAVHAGRPVTLMGSPVPLLKG